MIRLLAVFSISFTLCSLTSFYTTNYIYHLFFSPDPELDLPVLPPDDPRRKDYKKSERPPPQPPETPLETPPVFFGETIPVSSSLVYVLDFSQSMGTPARRIDYRTVESRWDVVAAEAQRSIKGLDPSIKFSVVVFGTNKGCGVSTWGPLRPATEVFKDAASAWLAQYQNANVYGGATPTAPAVLAAFGLEPDVIVLQTDGDPSACGIMGWPIREHRRVIRQNNENGIRIDVFGIGLNPQPREFCMGVAGDSGGNFFELMYKRP